VIVFSASHTDSGEVFVGSARESLEQEWAQLISQADDGAEGRFFDLLRHQGAAGFSVEEWGYADTPAELRELTREARQELGAEAIKSPRSRPATGIGRGASSLSMEAIMASIEEAAQEVDEELKKLEQLERQRLDGTAPVRAVTPAVAPRAVAPAPERIPLAPRLGVPVRTAPTPAPAARAVLSRKPAATDAPAMATGHSGSSTKEQRIREAIAVQREERDQHRHTHSRESQLEMNAIIARIEQRRQSSRKSPAKKAPAKTLKPAADTAAVTRSAAVVRAAAVAAPAPARLPEGRTGSSVREKRIREAIALEKAERDAQKLAQRAAEADEMAAILARLEERGKQADKLKRRR
jgi:colicin import membrane protein